MEQAESDPRRRFFNEGDDLLPPFTSPGWRGCGLNRDRFNHTRLPRFLFEALITASEAKELLLRLYTPDRRDSVRLPATWGAFRSFLFEPNNWSLEYVLHDTSGRWAVLADPDVIVIGAEAGLAAEVDELLEDQGTSLKQLTKTDFPELDPSDPSWRYLLAVSGVEAPPSAP